MARTERMSFNQSMAQPDSSISVFLHDILEKRRARNPKYSMRAFARDLGLSAGRLSDILTGRRIPGKELTKRISESLKFTDAEFQYFSDLIERHRVIHSEKAGAHQLRDDEFAIVADWEHFAILNLMGTAVFRSEIPWIAERFGISELRVQSALERLKRLGLVAVEGNQLIAVHSKVTTTHGVPSQAIRTHHQQMLEKGAQSLLQDDPEFRDITSIALAVDPSKLDEARKVIRDFRRKIASVLHEGERSEVYALNVQLVPLTLRKKQ